MSASKSEPVTGSTTAPQKVESVLPPFERYLTLVETADWLRCSPRTLQRLLETGDGPPVVRLSRRRLIFRLSDVGRWLDGRTRGVVAISEKRRRSQPRTTNDDHPPMRKREGKDAA